jgi:hypothetical protein
MINSKILTPPTTAKTIKIGAGTRIHGELIIPK